VEDTLAIVGFYSQESRDYLALLLKKPERSKRLLLDALNDALLGDQAKIPTNKGSRELGSHKIILRQPRLFPSLALSFKLLFGASEVEESVLTICRKYRHQKP